MRNLLNSVALQPGADRWPKHWKFYHHEGRIGFRQYEQWWPEVQEDPEPTWSWVS